MCVSSSSGDSVGRIISVDSVCGKPVARPLSDGSGSTGRGGADTTGGERWQVARGDIPLAAAAILRSNFVFGLSLAAVVSGDGGFLFGALAKGALFRWAALFCCGS